jgi:mono/diheme cytochrome c family protein
MCQQTCGIDRRHKTKGTPAMWKLQRSRAVVVPAILLALLAAFAPRPAMAEEDPIFGFVPPGGRTLLTGLLEAGAADPDIAAMLATDRDATGWQGWLQDSRDTIPGLVALDDWEMQTLAAYLDNMAPVATEGLTGDALRAAMPRDGRDQIMRHCQSCHIITVTVTQDRPREAWLGTLGSTSHVEIALTPTERSEVADYLVLNAGIPIDRIPPELRAGGASY